MSEEDRRSNTRTPASTLGRGAKLVRGRRRANRVEYQAPQRMSFSVLGRGMARFTATPPFHDHVGPLELDSRIVEQVAENRGRTVEREIRKHAERLTRKLDRCGVRLDDIDVRPATAKPARQSGIELDCEDAACRTGKL